VGIKKHREAAGMSQQELADKLGVSSSAVAMWETDNRTPRVVTLFKMSQMFGCSIEELMKKEE